MPVKLPVWMSNVLSMSQRLRPWLMVWTRSVAMPRSWFMTSVVVPSTISVIEIAEIDGEHQFEVLATNGDTFLGGEDFRYAPDRLPVR